jgi:hypothetical protein
MISPKQNGSLERSTGCPRDRPVVLSKTGIDIGFGWKGYLNGPKSHDHLNQVEFEFPLRCALPLFSSSSSQGYCVVVSSGLYGWSSMLCVVLPGLYESGLVCMYVSSV